MKSLVIFIRNCIRIYFGWRIKMILNLLAEFIKNWNTISHYGGIQRPQRTHVWNEEVQYHRVDSYISRRYCEKTHRTSMPSQQQRRTRVWANSLCHANVNRLWPTDTNRRWRLYSTPNFVQSYHKKYSKDFNTQHQAYCDISNVIRPHHTINWTLSM